MRVLLVATDDRRDLDVIEQHCIRNGTAYEIRATPQPALFGAVAWDFELWADTDDLPTAA